jgi:hypothetical protein
MSRSYWIPIVFVASALCLVVITSGELASQGPAQEVAVTNFPDPQRIEGAVEIRGPVQLSKLVAVRNITVPPVQPQDTKQWINAGVVTLGGFSHVVLSLQGLVKGSIKQPGAVGAVLVPEEESIRDAFDEQGQVQFPLQVAAKDVTSKTAYFASDQPRHTIAFQNYQLWLYNSTDKTVTANLFAYLTN